MDYNRWVEMQSNPPKPNPAIDPYAQYYNAQALTYTHYPYYPPQQPQIPNPNPNLANPQTAPEYHGITPTQYPATMNLYHHPHVSIEARPTIAYGHQQQTQVGALTASTTTYYQDPNVVAQNWAPKEVIHQYRADPVSYATVGIRPPTVIDPSVPTNPNPIYWTNPAVQQPNGTVRRKAKKVKVKVVQSVWCEVCKIDCNSKDVLDQHKLGKKHKKNLEKLEESKRNTNAPPPAPIPMMNPIIGPQENPSGDKPSKKKKASSTEDLETKRRRLMESGTAVDEMRVCVICNIACNSQTVFNYHLAGQKHASMMKKQVEGTAAPGPQVVTAT